MNGKPPTARLQQLYALYRSGAYAEADKQLRLTLQVTAKDPNLLLLAGLVAETLRELPRAVLLLQRALQQKPDWLEAQYNLARILSAEGKYAQAIELMQKISIRQPNLAPAQEALAKFNQLAGNLSTALLHWQQALTLQPEQQEWRAQYLLLRRQLCDWQETETFLTANTQLPPQAVIVLSDDPVIQKSAAEHYAVARYNGIALLPATPHSLHQRLRVGYLSGDFQAHATSYLLAELFSLHNRAAFEIFVYSYGRDDGSTERQRISSAAEHFIDLRQLNPATAAKRIKQDEIDILIDLKGYTRGSRLEILAHRPAPVQLHWLGFPGTLGTDFIDYFVGDAITIPAGSEHNFSEKVLRLPHCYQINDRQRPAPKPQPRSVYDLPEHGLILASFNQTYKITPEIFALWCELLRRLPDAYLWLYQSNYSATENLRRAASAAGIAPERLFFAKALPLEDHLARYHHVDLALDTFPVGGHTTTSDALWMGAPVVTLWGNSFVSRVAASILSAADLPELITTTPETYLELALALAHDPAKRQQIRQSLQQNRLKLPLFDTPHFVQDWEKILQQISLPTKKE